MSSNSLKQRLIAHGVRQFGRPRGMGGRLAGWVMTHRASNRQRNLWVVSLLDVRPTDHVLEIGFGPGIAIEQLARLATRGRIYGIDHSEVMVRLAARRNAAAVRAGRVKLLRASVEELPAFDQPLDIVLAVNALGFWPDPVQRLTELRGLLREGGRMVVVSQPRCPGATAETTVLAGQELRDRLSQAGFTEFRTETLALDPPVVCVIAR